MRRLLVRRSITAVGIYSSVVLGFLSTVVAARTFHSKEIFGLFTLVITATGFCQALFDLTVEEAVVKYGFHYAAREEWGRLRGLYRSALFVKLAGSGLGALGLLALAPFSHALFGDSRATVPLLIAAGIPIGQSLEGLAGTALFLRSRYDIRSAFLTWSMALRLAAVAIGARHGLVATVAGMVAAQVVATASIGAVARVGFRRFPRAARRPLGDDRPQILRFVLQSSAATGVLALRQGLAPILLGIVTSPTQAGFFKIAQAPQSGLQALSAPARMVLLTEQTRDWERGRRAEVLRGVRRCMLVAGLLMVVLLPPVIFFMPQLVELVYSARFRGAGNAARVFALAAGVQFLVGWTKSLPVAIGKPNLRVVTHGLETIVVLPLIVVLGLAWGATGAAVAVLAGMCVFAVQWIVIFLRLEPGQLAPPPALAESAAELEAEVGVVAR